MHMQGCEASDSDRLWLMSLKRLHQFVISTSIFIEHKTQALKCLHWLWLTADFLYVKHTLIFLRTYMFTLNSIIH